MKIIKKYSGVVPNGKVLNSRSQSLNDTYSCDYLNEQLNNEIYSTEEVRIGTWLGKPLYRKVIDFGALPNTTNKQVNNNVTNISTVVRAYGYATNGTNYFPIPFANTTANQSITLVAHKTNVEITTGIDRSAYSTCYITIEYTKTTD